MKTTTKSKTERKELPEWIETVYKMFKKTKISRLADQRFQLPSSSSLELSS